MAYRQLRTGGGNYVKWDTPKVIEGVILGYEAGEYKNKPTLHVIIKQDDGVVVKAPVSAAISSVNSAEAPIGGRLRLTYKGKEKGKAGQTYNDITAEYDDGTDTQAPAAPPAAPAKVDPALAAAAEKAAKIAEAKAALAALEAGSTSPAANVGVTEYETLLGKLKEVNPAMAEALPDVYPDPIVRLEKLKAVLKQHGVAA